MEECPKVLIAVLFMMPTEAETPCEHFNYPPFNNKIRKPNVQSTHEYATIRKHDVTTCVDYSVQQLQNKHFFGANI